MISRAELDARPARPKERGSRYRFYNKRTMSNVGEGRGWRSTKAQQPAQKQKTPAQAPAVPGRLAGVATPVVPSNAPSGEKPSEVDGANSTSGGKTAVEAFDAKAVKAFLQKSFDAATSGNKAAIVGAATQDGNKPRGAPWGHKPNSVASGKDFFAELRKQTSSLTQNERAGG